MLVSVLWGPFWVMVQLFIAAVVAKPGLLHPFQLKLPTNGQAGVGIAL
jgi:hypothetical protein